MLAVTAYPILYAFYLSFFRADLRTPDANEFIGLEQLRHGAEQLDLVDGLRDHDVHHRRQRLLRAGRSAWCWRSSCTARSSGAAWSAPRRWCPTPSSPWWRRSPGASPGPRAWAGCAGDAAPLTEQVALDLDHHPGRGLEDGAVHGAAADGRPGAGARGPAQGRLDGRCHRLAAVLEDHRAADQALDPGRAAVPHPRRLPDLRQHLRADQRGATTPSSVSMRGLQQPDHAGSTSASARPWRC